MIIDKNTLKLNNTPIGQYVVEATFDYHDLYSEDSGRNLAGTMIATLTGTYPKITVQFRSLNETDLKTVVGLFKNQTISVTYYDPSLEANKTIETYKGDWGYVQRNIGRTEGFSVSFISIRKR